MLVNVSSKTIWKEYFLTMAANEQLEHFKAMIRIRIYFDKSGTHFTYYPIVGGVYSNIPGQPLKKLFNIFGVNKARAVKLTDEKYFVNSKEVLFYTDSCSGKVLKTWQNPFTGETNEVFHIYNNPVNVPLFAAFKYSPTLLNDNQIVLSSTTVPLAYPNPVAPDVYPESSAGELYIASETFDMWANKQEAYSEKLDSAPGYIGWTRTAPWLPFMRMGKRTGGLVYMAHNWKLDNVSELPAEIAAAIIDLFPEFYEDPSPVETPNNSSWKEFRAEMGRRRDEGEPEVQLKNSGRLEMVITNSLGLTSKYLDLLGSGQFRFNVTGQGTAVGCIERLPGANVAGNVSITNQRSAEGSFKLSIQYTLDQSDSTSHPKVISNETLESGTKTLQTPKRNGLSGKFDATVDLKDMTALTYNGKKYINFPVRYPTENMFGSLFLVFPGGQTDQALLSANFIVTWQKSWFGDAPPNGYTVVGVHG